MTSWNVVWAVVLVILALLAILWLAQQTGILN